MYVYCRHVFSIFFNLSISLLADPYALVSLIPSGDSTHRWRTPQSQPGYICICFRISDVLTVLIASIALFFVAIASIAASIALFFVAITLLSHYYRDIVFIPTTPRREPPHCNCGGRWHRTCLVDRVGAYSTDRGNKWNGIQIQIQIQMPDCSVTINCIFTLILRTPRCHCLCQPPPLYSNLRSGK